MSTKLATYGLRQRVREHFESRAVERFAVRMANRTGVVLTLTEQCACVVLAMKYVEDEPLPLLSLFHADVARHIPTAERTVLKALDYRMEPTRQRPSTPTPFL